MPDGPTTELGGVNPEAGLPGVASWSTFVDEAEYVPELQWPESIRVYDRMMTDAQVASLLRSVSLPLQRRRWVLDPNGADASSVTTLADDLGLPVRGSAEEQPRRRRRNRFNFSNHLPLALGALGYGYYYFEQVGEIGDDGLWHLRKLAPRPPRTIGEIKVAKDGSLEHIKQALGFRPPPIPVDRLVCYVWGFEAGNWTGKPMIRPLYKNWIIKDRLLRVDAIKHERSGMGIPIAEAPPGSSAEEVAELSAMMQSMKVTETGGGAVPAGSKPMLMGTTGQVPDTIASVRFHNEEMSSAFLAMFKDLGQTSYGSRALGETMADFFSLGLDAIADWICDVFNEHVIEDWYDWNFGEDSQPALLVHERDEDPDLDAQDLKALIESGAIQVDNEIEDEVRRRADFPERSSPRTSPAPPPAVAPPSSSPAGDGEEEEGSPPVEARRGRAAAAGVSESPSLPLPARPLRRMPYEHEVRAQTDFAAIDATLTGSRDQLVNEVLLHRNQQIEELHDAIVEANGDMKKLALIQAEPNASDTIRGAMLKSADAGISQATAEASRQGVVDPEKPSVDDLMDRIEARAIATDRVLASDLGTAAGQQAIRRTGEGKTAAQVADEVKEYLNGLSNTYLQDRLGGALTQAMNDGRKAAMSANNAERVYASELLDANTCENCVAIDGAQYQNVDDANADYPTGGYAECLGQERCRGTLVAVYNEDTTL